MSAILPINADDLLRGRSIESVRVEFKASWNRDTTGFQVLRTICAVEARGLLERVTAMDASPARHAWAWRDLARALSWLRAPASEVESAFRNALRLLPDEPRFAEELGRFRKRQRERRRRPAGGDRNGRRSVPQ